MQLYLPAAYLAFLALASGMTNDSYESLECDETTTNFENAYVPALDCDDEVLPTPAPSKFDMGHADDSEVMAIMGEILAEDSEVKAIMGEILAEDEPCAEPLSMKEEDPCTETLSMKEEDPCTETLSMKELPTPAVTMMAEHEECLGELVEVGNGESYCVTEKDAVVCGGDGDKPVGTACPKEGAVAGMGCTTASVHYNAMTNSCVLEESSTCQWVQDSGKYGCVVGDGAPSTNKINSSATTLNVVGWTSMVVGIAAYFL